MQEIANQGNIEDIALIQYTADDLQGERRDKAVLYGSRTLTKLKKNIEIFDKIKEGIRQRMRVRKNERRNVASVRISTSPMVKNCYGCGSIEHRYRVCIDKDMGLKYFKCNNFGHIAIHCNKSSQSAKNVSGGNFIHISDKVALKINGLLAYVLLYTDSEISVINSEVYDKIERLTLYETARRFTDNAITKPIGKFKADIDIGDDKYDKCTCSKSVGYARRSSSRKRVIKRFR